jgi:hypothetical protein
LETSSTCHAPVETSYFDGFLSLKKCRNRWGGVTFAAIPKNADSASFEKLPFKKLLSPKITLSENYFPEKSPLQKNYFTRKILH